MAAGETVRQLNAAVRDPAFHARVRQVGADAIRSIGPVIADEARRVGRELAYAHDNAIPGNWQGTVTEMVAISEFMRESGWSLTWTPPYWVISEVLATPDLRERQSVVEAAEPLILADLDRLLRGVDRPMLDHYIAAARQALEAHRSGYFWPCQALCAAALTTAVHDLWEHKKLGKARAAFERLHPNEAGLFDLRAYAVRGAVGRVLRNYPDDGPVPIEYNRHASTHDVDPRQFTDFNSLLSVMLLVSVILEVDTTRRLAERYEQGEDVSLSA